MRILVGFLLFRNCFLVVAIFHWKPRKQVNICPTHDNRSENLQASFLNHFLISWYLLKTPPTNVYGTVDLSYLTNFISGRGVGHKGPLMNQIRFAPYEIQNSMFLSLMKKNTKIFLIKKSTQFLNVRLPSRDKYP